MGPKNMHLANRVSKPRLPWGEIFLVIIIVLNLAVFSFGGFGVLCSSVKHLQRVQAWCSRKMISVAAGLGKLCSCRSDLRGGKGKGMSLGRGRGWSIEG